MKKCFLIALATLLPILMLGTFRGGIAFSAANVKTVTDMCDHEVTIPVSPERIACMHCVSPEKIMTLGKGSLISLMSEQSPWAYRLFPEIKSAHSNAGVTPEQMLEMGIDFVLYTPGMTKAEPYSAAGLTSVCAFSAETRPMTLDAYMENFTRQVRFFGEILGPDAKERAERYISYFEETVSRILAVTSKIDAEDRPAVYYGGLKSDLLRGQGNGSVMHWNTVVSGGDYLPRALEDNHATATLDQVLAWDPEIILLSGLCDSVETVTKDPQWASLTAVKNGKVHLIPQGVYTWDHASNESVLLMIYMAKLFYPDLFKDWDMRREMMRFYSEVYGRSVSEADVERILNHLPPT